MPTLFAANAGRVVALPDPGAVGIVSGVDLEGWGGFPGFRAIITRVMIGQAGNYQLQHTFGSLVHVYIFGDRIGDVMISGLAFDRDCNALGGAPLGIEAVAAYYQANRIAGRPTPLKVAVGTSRPMNCLLLKMTADIVDAQTRMFQFNLQLALIPIAAERNARRRVRGGFGAGETTQTQDTGPTPPADPAANPSGSQNPVASPIVSGNDLPVNTTTTPLASNWFPSSSAVGGALWSAPEANVIEQRYSLQGPAPVNPNQTAVYDLQEFY